MGQTSSTSLGMTPLVLSFLFCLLSCASPNDAEHVLNGFCAGQPGIPGTPGRNGHPGVAGRDGRSGRDGMPGMPGMPGGKGEAGPTGPKGELGDDGMHGIPGEKGAKGISTISFNSAFSAKRSKSHIFPLTDEPVQFDVVLHNDQHHYNPATGKFTCEIPGLYYFVVHSTVFRTSLQFDIMKNNVTVSSFFQYFANFPKPVSLSGGALIHLSPGEQVWVQVVVGDYNGIYSSTKTDSSFIGFLLYSDWKNAHLMF